MVPKVEGCRRGGPRPLPTTEACSSLKGDSGTRRVSTAGAGGVLDSTHSFQRWQDPAVPGGAEQICTLGFCPCSPGRESGQEEEVPRGLANLS